MQNLENIFDNISSFVTSPVTSPRWYRTCFKSTVSKSDGILFFNPSLTLLISFFARLKAE